jgi:hypothetical protein
VFLCNRCPYSTLLEPISNRESSDLRTRGAHGDSVLLCRTHTYSTVYSTWIHFFENSRVYIQTLRMFLKYFEKWFTE